MIISASIQAANQLNLLDDILKNKSKFDQIHLDITDGHFTNNISMSFQHLKQLKLQTNYLVDVHLMLENNTKYTEIAYDYGADLVNIHYESTDFKEYLHLTKKYSTLGIGILPETPLIEIAEYINYSYSVLLLGVTPGFSNQLPVIDFKQKLSEFNKLYPSYEGLIILDGGISTHEIPYLFENGASIVVQGGAIFA